MSISQEQPRKHPATPPLELVVCGFDSTGLPRHAQVAPANQGYLWRCCDSRDCDYKRLKELTAYCAYDRGTL